MCGTKMLIQKSVSVDINRNAYTKFGLAKFKGMAGRASQKGDASLVHIRMSALIQIRHLGVSPSSYVCNSANSTCWR